MTTEERLRERLRTHLGQVLGMAPEAIDLSKGLSTYGLDSIDAVLMAGDLEESFGIEIDPARFLAFDTFADIITTLAPDIDKERGRPVSS
jgi:acyl carrier protein